MTNTTNNYFNPLTALELDNKLDNHLLIYLDSIDFINTSTIEKIQIIYENSLAEIDIEVIINILHFLEKNNQEKTNFIKYFKYHLIVNTY